MGTSELGHRTMCRYRRIVGSSIQSRKLSGRHFLPCLCLCPCLCGSGHQEVCLSGVLLLSLTSPGGQVGDRSDSSASHRPSSSIPAAPLTRCCSKPGHDRLRAAPVHVYEAAVVRVARPRSPRSRFLMRAGSIGRLTRIEDRLVGQPA